MAQGGTVRHGRRWSAEDQKVKPVGSGLRVSCVPGVLHGAAEPFLAPQELLLGEAAHDGVGAAEVVRLVEEPARLVSVSGTCSSASRRNPAVANARQACPAEG
jgi:hypothetical protein